MAVKNINHQQKPNLSVIAGCFLCLACFILSACQPDQEKVAGPDTLTLIPKSGEKIYLEVELAITPAEMSVGLMGRESLPEDAGMLFYFTRPTIPGFWMKNTLIPLDMIFIKDGGEIVHIHENAIPHDLLTIRPPEPVIAVLEINGGLSSKFGISVGDRIKHPLFQASGTQ